MTKPLFFLLVRIEERGRYRAGIGIWNLPDDCLVSRELTPGNTYPSIAIHMSSLFSLPLKPSQQPSSFRTSFQKPSKKRKREQEDSDTQVDLSEAGPSQGASKPSSLTAPVLSPDDEYQYRVAGQPVDESIPGGHFPHAPAPVAGLDGLESDGEKAEARLRQELAGLSPPLYPSHQSLTATVGEESQSGVGLRLRHLAVLNAILHRCLLEGDFIRAGRAWGMLLRSEVHGRPIDLRAKGVWGIGAEILMRRDAQVAAERRKQRRPEDSNGDENNDSGRCDRTEELWFSREGFDKARLYYERLILQYPYRRIAPHSVSSLDFYPVMFGLWIYSIQEEFRIAKSRLEVKGEDSGSDDDEQMDDIYDEQGSARSVTREQRKRLRRYERLEDLRKSQLEQAEQVAIRLDELLLSPPYSDSHQLLRIRGMMALWIGDLSVVSVLNDQVADKLHSWSVETSDQLMDLDQIREDYNRGLTKKSIQIDKARSIFVKLVDKGATIPREVEHLLDYREL